MGHCPKMMETLFIRPAKYRPYNNFRMYKVNIFLEKYQFKNSFLTGYWIWSIRIDQNNKKIILNDSLFLQLTLIIMEWRIAIKNSAHRINWKLRILGMLGVIQKHVQLRMQTSFFVQTLIKYSTKFQFTDHRLWMTSILYVYVVYSLLQPWSYDTDSSLNWLYKYIFGRPVQA